MFKSNLNIFALGIALVFCLNLFHFWGCQEKDNQDPCEGMPIDSCLVDTCKTDSCLGDTAAVFGEWKSLGLVGENILSVSIDPKRPWIIFAGSQFDFSSGHYGKLFKSTNYGHSWDTLIVGQFGWNFRDIVIDPVDPNIIYTASGGYGANTCILKSTNGGNTWQEMSNGIFLDGETWVADISLNPHNTNVLYGYATGYTNAALYKSTDGAFTWSNATYNNDFRAFGALTFDPFDIHNIYIGAGSGKVYKSTNDGLTWIKLDSIPTSDGVGRIIVLQPSCFLVGVWNSGLFRSTDAGFTWQHISSNLSDPLYIPSLQIDPTNSMTLYGTALYEDYKSNNGGYVWTILANNQEFKVLKAIDNSGAKLYGINNGLFVFRIK
ncbi:hypothetical protein F9K33_12160 [bacterium]|nr:MAG: hypothetical protein F9K33_12160 [bacterium]